MTNELSEKESKKLHRLALKLSENLRKCMVDYLLEINHLDDVHKLMVFENSLGMTIAKLVSSFSYNTDGYQRIKKISHMADSYLEDIIKYENDKSQKH